MIGHHVCSNTSVAPVEEIPNLVRLFICKNPFSRQIIEAVTPHRSHASSAREQED